MKLFGWEYAWGYVLPADLVREVPIPAPGAYYGRWLRITPAGPGRTRLALRATYKWDGCTGVPDPPGSKDGSALHDAIYQFAEKIAAECGCTVSEVLQFGDAVFEFILRQDKCPVAGLYSSVVRWVGVHYHYARRWVRSFMR
jgi:hypothetical protein